MSLFDQKAVAAAVRTEEDFSAALESKVDVIFLLYSSIMTVEAQIERAHKAGKKALIHMDFAEGIGKDRAGLHFIKLKGADDILTTKTNMIRPAKDIGLVTVQRFFIVDSHSVDTAVESIRIAKPDVVEIMPGRRLQEDPRVCGKGAQHTDPGRWTHRVQGGCGQCDCIRCDSGINCG